MKDIIFSIVMALIFFTIAFGIIYQELHFHPCKTSTEGDLCSMRTDSNK